MMLLCMLGMLGIVILNVHRILLYSPLFFIVDIITVADDAWRHFF